jgi:hypothetical protein
MIFGVNSDKGLVLENGKLKAVTIGQDGYSLTIYWCTMQRMITSTCKQH